MFFDVFSDLCNSAGTTPTRVAIDLGLSRSLPTYWKKSHTAPQLPQLQKIADYFHVSVDYLVGNEKKPVPNVDGNELSESEIEMLRRFRNLSEAKQNAVLEILKHG